MQSPHNKSPFFSKEVGQNITALFTQASCLVQSVIAEMVSFGNKNRSKLSGYGQQQKYFENKFQNELFQSQPYYYFEIKFKAIPNLLKQITSQIHIVDTLTTIKKIELCTSQIKSFIQYLKEERANQLRKQPVPLNTFVGESYVETAKYIDQLNAKINKIYQSLIIAKQALNQNLTNSAENIGEHMKMSTQQSRSSENKNSQLKSESQNLQKISQTLDHVKSQINQLCVKYPQFKAKNSVYQKFGQSILEWDKITKVTLKDKQRIKFYKDSSTKQVENLKQNLLNLRNQFVKNKASTYIGFNRQIFASSIESHFDSLNQYLLQIQQNLAQIKDSNFNENPSLFKSQIKKESIIQSPNSSQSSRMMTNSRILNEEKNVSKTHTKLNQPQNKTAQKNRKSLQDSMHDLIGSVSFINDELTNIIPKITYPPHQHSSTQVNLKKIITIQQQANKVADQFSELLVQIQERAKRVDETSRFELDELSQGKNVAAQFEQKIRQMKIEHQTQISQLNSQVFKLKQDIKNLQKQRKQAAQSNEKAIDQIMGSNKKLIAQIEVKETELELMNVLNQKLQKIKEQKISLQNEIQALRLQLLPVQSQGDSRANLQDSHGSQKQLNAQVTELKAQFNKITEQNADLKHMLSLAQSQLKQYSSDKNDKPRQQLVMSQLKKSNTKSSIKDSYNYKNQNMPKSQIRANDDDKFQHLDDDQMLKKQIDIIASIHTFKKQLTVLQVKATSQKSLLDSLDHQITAKQTLIKESDAQNSQLIMNNNQLSQQNNQLQLKNNELKHKSEQLQSSCDKLYSQLKEHESKYDAKLKESEAKENSLINETSLKLTQLNQELVQKQQQLSNKQKQLIKMTEQINQISILSIRTGYEILNLFKSIDIHSVQNQVRSAVDGIYKIKMEDPREAAKKIRSDKASLVNEGQKRRKQLEESLKLLSAEIKSLSPISIGSNEPQKLSSSIQEGQNNCQSISLQQLTKEFEKVKKYISVSFQLIEQHIRILKTDEQISGKEQRILQTKIDNKKNEFQVTNTENENKKIQLKQLLGQIKQLEGKKVALTQSVESIRNQNQSDLNVLVLNTGERSSYKARYEEIQKQVEKLNDKIVVIEGEKHQLNSKMLGLQKKLQLKTDEECKEKEKQLIDLRQKCKRLQDTVNRQSHFQGDKEELESDLLKLIDEFKSQKESSQQRSSSSSTSNNQTIFALRSILKEKDQRITNLATQLGQFNDFKVLSQRAYNQKFQELKARANQQIKKITQNFDQVNQRASNQRLKYWNENQELKQKLQLFNGCIKQVYNVNSSYLKARSPQTKLDHQLLESLEYQLTINDLQTILSSVVCVIYEGQTLLSHAQGSVKFYQKTIDEYYYEFSQATSLEDIKSKLKSKTQSYSAATQSIAKLNQAIVKFADQTFKSLQKQIDTAQQSAKKARDSYINDLENCKNKLKKQFSDQLNQQLQLKDKQIAKLKLDLETSKQESQINKILVDSLNQQLEKSQATCKQLTAKNKELFASNENLMVKISQNSKKNFESLRQKDLQLKQKISQLTSQISDNEDIKNCLQKDIKEAKQQLNSTKRNLMTANKSNVEKDKTIQQLNDQIQVLERKNNSLTNQTKSLNSAQYELSRLKDSLTQAKREVDDLKAVNSKQRLQLMQSGQLSSDKTKLQTRVNQLMKEIEALKLKHSESINSVNSQSSQLFRAQTKLTTDLQFCKNVIKEIEETIRQKFNINQQIQPKDLSDVIRNFNPVAKVGCRLITSLIIHGYDEQRNDIIKKIEGFTNKKIIRTDLMGRFPDKKSLLADLPRNEGFIMLYKSSSGRVFGTFSEGLRQKTFTFAYWAELYNRYQEVEREASPVKFFVPEVHSSSVSSVEVIQNRYLKYGNDELRINLMDLSSISANSDATGQKYYMDFQWREIMGENKEDGIPLDEVEVHNVKFE